MSRQYLALLLYMWVAGVRYGVRTSCDGLAGEVRSGVTAKRPVANSLRKWSPDYRSTMIKSLWAASK